MYFFMTFCFCNLIYSTCQSKIDTINTKNRNVDEVNKKNFKKVKMINKV
jgi:hypothetical protein